MQGNQPSFAFAFCLLLKNKIKIILSPLLGAGTVRVVAKLSSPGAKDSWDHYAWPRQTGYICVSVHVRLVAKFSDRFRQWGGLQRGRFGEIRGGRAANLNWGTDTRALRRLVELRCTGLLPLAPAFLSLGRSPSPLFKD